MRLRVVSCKHSRGNVLQSASKISPLRLGTNDDALFPLARRNARETRDTLFTDLLALASNLRIYNCQLF